MVNFFPLFFFLTTNLKITFNLRILIPQPYSYAQGTVRCVGTPLFLKSQYGVGYHLTMVKLRGTSDQHDVCNVAAVRQLIESHVPNASMTSNVSEGERLEE